MIEITLEDLKNLKEEAVAFGLQLDHHNVVRLLTELTNKADYYARLVDVVTLLESRCKCSRSTFIGPFLSIAGRKLADEITGSIDEGNEP